MVEHRQSDQCLAVEVEQPLRCRIDEGQPAEAVHREHPRADVTKDVIGLQPDPLELGGEGGLLHPRLAEPVPSTATIPKSEVEDHDLSPGCRIQGRGVGPERVAHEEQATPAPR